MLEETQRQEDGNGTRARQNRCKIGGNRSRIQGGERTDEHVQHGRLAAASISRDRQVPGEALQNLGQRLRLALPLRALPDGALVRRHPIHRRLLPEGRRVEAQRDIDAPVAEQRRTARTANLLIPRQSGEGVSLNYVEAGPQRRQVSLPRSGVFGALEIACGSTFAGGAVAPCEVTATRIHVPDDDRAAIRVNVDPLSSSVAVPILAIALAHRLPSPPSRRRAPSAPAGRLA